MERKFKVGDRVRIREWDDMAKEFGVDRVLIDEPFINCTFWFPESMSELCGHTAEIEKIEKNDEGVDYCLKNWDDPRLEDTSKYRSFSADMLELVEDENKSDESVKDPIKPAHYNQGKLECIDEMIILFGKEAVIGFCKCNIYKYKTRASMKNGQEDLEKADRYIELLEEKFGICVETEVIW